MSLSRSLVVSALLTVLVSGCAGNPATTDPAATPTLSVTVVEIDPDRSLEEQLFEAIRGGDVEYVNALIDAGVDINADLSAGSTALHLAVQRDDLALLGAIIAAGADLDALNGSQDTALGVACQQGRSAGVIEALLVAGANHDIPINDQVGSYPIHGCAASGNTQAVEVLVLHGIDPNARNRDIDATPILVAAWRGDAAMIETLLRLGADPLLEDIDGMNALDWARSFNRTEAVAVLEAAGY